MPTARKKTPDTQDSLAQAFSTFTRAADSLEAFYATLQAEVRRLSLELEQTNRKLSLSLEENRQMRAYLGRILDALPCGVVVVDPQGSPTLVNPEARRLLGIQHDSYSPGTGPLGGILKRFGLLPLPQHDDPEPEWNIDGPDGSRHIGVRRTRLPGSGPEGDERVCILRDLTDEKRLQSEREAARRVQALADMATLLAHEVRNPLGSLELFAGLLADNSQNGTEPRQWADQLQAGLRTLSATVDNVLQIHSTPQMEHSEVDVGNLLAETVRFLAPLARQWDSRVEYFQTDANTCVWGEPHSLRQVFLNLAINAFKAMPLGGVLRISVVKGCDQSVQIDFKDQGAGISPENLERVFEAGFTTTPNGSGLGLSVCKKIVEDNGGKIGVRTSSGEGTVFTLNLPAIGEPK